MLADVSERDLVICGVHGEAASTFTCRHVATGAGCGFHASDEDPSDPWPDAWCDLCEERRGEGAPREAVADQARITLLCTHCYESARELNRQVPVRARGAAVRLDEDERARLLHYAVHATQAAQASLSERWGVGRMARWDYDDQADTLTFSDPSQPTRVADVRLVGSYSTRTGTFQWAWKTYPERHAKSEAVARLRVFGEVRGIPELTVDNRACEEVDAWEMTSIASHVLGAEGIYRAPFDHQYWFMLLSNFR
jgi:hypothetical protein